MRVNSTDLQNAFGKYLSLVEKEDIIVVKNGKTVAKLIHYTEPANFLIYEEAKEYNATRKISYKEYMSIVNSSEQRYELIDGQIYLMASPGYNHQIMVNEISWYFNNYFKGKACRSLTAPLDVRLSGYALKFEEDPNVVQPDILVICDEDKVNEDNKYEGVPSLIVEVLSPSTKSKDMISKLNLYMKSGVLEYWIVNLENKKITQYSFTDDRELDNVQEYEKGDEIESKKFEGLKIILEDIFSEI
ncbi:MAG: type II toxin-antitoxin system prevent-host-death family antitoxin [Halanaerobiaceae bacterium]